MLQHTDGRTREIRSKMTLSNTNGNWCAHHLITLGLRHCGVLLYTTRSEDTVILIKTLRRLTGDNATDTGIFSREILVKITLFLVNHVYHVSQQYMA